MKLSFLSVFVRMTALFAVVGFFGGCTGGSLGNVATCSSDAASSSLANWSGVKTVIGFYCGGAGCHNEGQQPAFFPDNDATLYRTLMEHKVAKCGGRVLVKPCAPEDSAFYRAQAGTCETLPRMPFGCGEGSCTSAEDLEGIRQWIANGAPME
jgi:hypothetical protein